MNGTIVCALTEPAGADAAVRAATRLAEGFGSRIVLLSVIEGIGAEDGEESVTTAQTRSGARRWLDRLATQHELAARADQRVEVGAPIETLTAVAAEEAAELIVLGSRPGLRRRTLKSELARELAAHALCPVLVAPPGGAPAANERDRAARVRS
jgi:nucleotide-binding universal stress UspA family protein